MTPASTTGGAGTHRRRRYVGIDLAWGQRARTGLAVVDDAGALVASASARSDGDIDDWLAAHALGATVIGIDAPLVVPNVSGMRECEKQVSRAFGRYGIGCHASHRGMPTMDPPRAEKLAARHGWVPDPEHAPSVRTPVGLEVYPHAALVGLFGLDYRLAYKKGPFPTRSAEFARLVELLTGVPELRLTDNARWAELAAAVAAAVRPSQLDGVEDEIDAVLCAHVAWLWQCRRTELHVYGDVGSGFIVAPPPPTHPTVGPASRPVLPRSRR